MIEAVFILLLAQLAGEIAVRALALPLPGPVVGLVLLLVALVWRGRPPDGLEPAADGLLRHLSLLFVPAGVGVVQHIDLILAHGVALITALIVSTALTVAVTALVFAGVRRLVLGPGEDGGRAP